MIFVFFWSLLYKKTCHVMNDDDDHTFIDSACRGVCLPAAQKAQKKARPWTSHGRAFSFWFTPTGVGITCLSFLGRSFEGVHPHGCGETMAIISNI